MQYSIVAVAALAGLSYAAESTVYMTEKVTITSCAASVTNCPARSTVTSITSYPVITSSAVSSAPAASSTSVCDGVYNACIQEYLAAGGSPNFSDCNAREAKCVGTISAPVAASTPASYANTTAPVVIASSTALGAASVPAPAASSPAVSVITISTCIPTVIYSTITPSAPVYTPAASTGTVSYSHNATAPAATSTPKPSTITANGASSLSASLFVAALAGAAAFILA